MLRTVIERTGFKQLFESSRSKADAVLAKVPSALSHFALDALFERPVQTELVELLLLPKEAQRFTSCVLAMLQMYFDRSGISTTPSQRRSGTESREPVPMRLVPTT